MRGVGEQVRETVDLDGYISSRVEVLNASTGTRGYDTGVRIFNCPLCNEDRGRGWMNVERYTAGCWNAGCQAEPRLSGGAIEWVRLMESFPGRGVTWRFLLKTFPSYTKFKGVRAQPASHEDFCILPPEFTDLVGYNKVGSALGKAVSVFLQRQWGMSVADGVVWKLGVCFSGRYGGRVIIPITENSQNIAFQARSFRGGEPKYLNSRPGAYGQPNVECGRPMGEVLFNTDGAPRDGEVLLVEGAGDVMGWHKGDLQREPHAIGLLGMALTPEKAALLRELGPSKVIVALDNEPAARRRAFTHIEDLQAWGIPAVFGEWVGGKDAGAGAALKILDGMSLKARISSQLGG
jgi:hypothetical protein